MNACQSNIPIGSLSRITTLIVMICIMCFLTVGCAAGVEPEIPELTTIAADITAVTTIPPKIILPEGSTFSIHFIDVGQADAALIECDGRYMLIDGGNKGDSDVLYTVLKNAGVQKLDIVVGTHAHEDHIGGLPGAFSYTTADLTLCSVTEYDSDAFRDFKRYADERGGGITVPAVGDSYMLGSAVVSILGVNSAAGDNNGSIVLLITYGDTKFLFTGDAEREAEQAILASGADLSVDVLKVGHHGSDTSTTYPFLREIMPTYAVISVGKDNAYGHPTDDTLSRLRDADVEVYRTDLQGDIYCASDGTTVTITTERMAGTETTAPVTSGTGYVLNTNTKKFHIPTCASVKQMSEKNKTYFTGTRDDAIAMGYSACKNCAP